MKENLKVAWISAGVSSFIAAYLCKDLDRAIYIDIDDQHPDSVRFINDCAKYLPCGIEILKSRYNSVDEACRAYSYIVTPKGARCTYVLKKEVRKIWEREAREKYNLTYVWGMDDNEKERAARLIDIMPYCEHEFPLIDNAMTKAEAHGLLEKLGIKRPVMYDLGYNNNNNCIGCVKGGMGYWNKIRVDFPEVFASRCKLERDIGHSILKGVFLDELDPQRGRNEKIVVPECGIMCEINGGA